MIANSTTELCVLLPRKKDMPKLTQNMCFFAATCNAAGPWKKATCAFLAPALLFTVRPHTGEQVKGNLCCQAALGCPQLRYQGFEDKRHCPGCGMRGGGGKHNPWVQGCWGGGGGPAAVVSGLCCAVWPDFSRHTRPFRKYTKQ